MPLSVMTLQVIALTVLLLLINTGVGNTTYVDPVLDPVTLSDQHNNTANNESVITWAPLPAGLPYVTDTNVTDDAIVANFLTMMRGFVKILQPKDIDYELVSNIITGETALVDGAKSLGTFIIGYGICLFIGIVFLIFFPLCGCCCCCCRLCGNCGGKKLQKEPIKGCKCVVFSVIVNVMVTGIFMGALMTIIMDDRLSSSFKYVTNATDSNIADVNSFLNNTADQVDFIALDGFNFTAKVLLRDLNNVGVLLGIPVRDGLEAALGIDPAIQSIIDMDGKVDDVTAAMEQTEWARGNFSVAYDALESALSTLSTNLATPLADVNCTSVPSCNAMDESLILANPLADPELIPSLNASLQSLYDLQNQDIEGTALKGKKSFDELPERITNDTAAQIAEIESMLNTFSTEIQNNLGGIDELTQNTAELDSLKDSLTSYTDILDTYDGYRSAGFWAVASLLLITVLLWVLGLCIGPFTYNGLTKPTERRCCSNCAGIFLMAAAGVSWIVSVLFMMFTFFPFLIGYPLEKFVCDPLTDPEYKIFKYLLDEPGGLLSSDGYFMGELLFGNGSIDLTLSGVLENNEPAFQAMKLENLIDLDQVTNYEDTLNITEQVQQMASDMGSVELISQDTIDQLKQFSDATQVNYTAFYAVLSLNLTLTNLQQFLTDLNASTLLVTAGGTKTSLEGYVVDLDNIIDNEYATALNWQNIMRNKTEAMEAVAGSVPDQVNSTVNATESLEHRIQSGYGNETLNTQIQAYSTRLYGIVDSFVSQVVNQLTNELGRCEPVWNVWDSLVVTGLCNYVVDTFNGFWFALGMAVFSSFFAIIFSIKLAKYYRTMKHLDGEEDDPNKQEDYDSDVEDTGNGYDNNNSHLTNKGSGPQHMATAGALSGPKNGAMGKASFSPPPRYNSVDPNGFDF